MTRMTTLLDLVMEVSTSASSEAELIATVVSLVNSGQATLCGSFRGSRFDPTELGITAELAR